MKILFDNQKFTTDTHGGIVRYFAELMRCYETMPDIDYDMPITFSNTEYLKVLPRFAHVKPLRALHDFLPSLNFRGKAKLYRVWCKIGSGRKNYKQTVAALKRNDYDVLHPTYYDASLLTYLKNKPLVLTVYDMIHELFLAKNALFNPTIENKKKLAKQATRIIAISESTKRDVMRMLDIPADKIDVIYLASDLTPSAVSIANGPTDAPSRYMLFVGSRAHYKNFDVFAQAVAPLLQETPDLHLLCIGGGRFDAAEEAFFVSKGIAKQVHHRMADDQKLAQYYAHAEAFVFPTLYEGFGIPVLEAFACGCPAILSNTSSLPEVGGEAAVYFDPTDQQSIYQAVKNVVASPDKQAAMRIAGLQQLQKFSWDKTAQHTIETYHKAIKNYK